MKEFQNEQLFQELNNEVAANCCSGGTAILYDLTNQRVELGRFEWGKDRFSARANNDVSSVHITSGVWGFFENFNYGGDRLILGPGKHNLRDFNFDQKMSSLHRLL